ncbi:hypothetical protein M501DRAFT_1055960 [Patellaria atrata CBS 101060]|uniref:Uncharacterized protein n=1 Tax=Patellaria atrata CBS 101060 TaxID=1346257 RepID=A0A9P4SFG6_9PEZI|nr:hypothetical protein M501DRAFT_1055960 [Patellaria atrata CBS 101060]
MALQLPLLPQNHQQIIVNNANNGWFNLNQQTRDALSSGMTMSQIIKANKRKYGPRKGRVEKEGCAVKSGKIKKPKSNKLKNTTLAPNLQEPPPPISGSSELEDTSFWDNTANALTSYIVQEPSYTMPDVVEPKNISFENALATAPTSYNTEYQYPDPSVLGEFEYYMSYR